ncbi:Coenzyme Q-binding protein COQ10-like protein A, mitochondrial [Aphelenchoides besseyi]|nr:Coenzyme Q-binding protein COQ10-like protein A, mitochondrial [Aphelenchoides besseyi]
MIAVHSRSSYRFFYSTGQRNLFGFGPQMKKSRVTSYGEQRVIGYTAPQMFDVVHTVAEYPQFVPWCKRADVRKINRHVLEAELFIGYPPFHENYTSRVTSLYPNVVRSIVTEGRIFKFLETTWRFGPTDDGFPANSCNLDFTLEFEFKSALHAQFTQLFFGQVVRTMVTAFLNRAEQLYGPPSFDHFNQGVKSYTIKPER